MLHNYHDSIGLVGRAELQCGLPRLPGMSSLVASPSMSPAHPGGDAPPLDNPGGRDVGGSRYARTKRGLPGCSAIANSASINARSARRMSG